jgi:Zn-dependent M16 (insulinase) family peptidase
MELMDLQARRRLYPENVGFRYETGGMMEQLRVLTADRIRAFHREMYQPRNLSLILTGEIDHHNLLTILADFEEGTLGDIPIPDASFKRPWVDSPPTPPLKESIVDRVEFPEEDESSGEILIGFLGPDLNDTEQCT